MKAISVLLSSLFLISAAWAADLQSELMAKEEMLWTAWGHNDVLAFKRNMTGDSVQIGSSGSFSGIESILKAMSTQTCDMRDFEAQNVQMRRLGQDVVVLNYTYTQAGTCNGEKLPTKLAVTSIYVQEEGRWLSAHYHESTVT